MLLIKESLRRDRLHLDLCHVEDGVQALEYLRKQPPFADAPTPDLILLDLNMPRMSGHELLAELKQDPELKVIPVVVLTTSSRPADIRQSYLNHASCFVTKPVTLNDFRRVLQETGDFWLSIVRLPKG